MWWFHTLLTSNPYHIPYHLPLCPITYPIIYPYTLSTTPIIYPYTLSSTPIPYHLPLSSTLYPIIYPHTLSSTPTYALIYAFIYPPLHPLFLGTRKWVTHLLFPLFFPPSPTSHITSISHLLHHTSPTLHSLIYTPILFLFSEKNQKI